MFINQRVRRVRRLGIVGRVGGWGGGFGSQLSWYFSLHTWFAYLESWHLHVERSDFHQPFRVTPFNSVWPAQESSPHLGPLPHPLGLQQGTHFSNSPWSSTPPPHPGRTTALGMTCDTNYRELEYSSGSHQKVQKSEVTVLEGWSVWDKDRLDNKPFRAMLSGLKTHTCRSGDMLTDYSPKGESHV